MKTEPEVLEHYRTKLLVASDRSVLLNLPTHPHLPAPLYSLRGCTSCKRSHMPIRPVVRVASAHTFYGIPACEAIMTHERAQHPAGTARGEQRGGCGGADICVQCISAFLAATHHSVLRGAGRGQTPWARCSPYITYKIHTCISKCMYGFHVTVTGRRGRAGGLRSRQSRKMHTRRTRRRRGQRAGGLECSCTLYGKRTTLPRSSLCVCILILDRCQEKCNLVNDSGVSNLTNRHILIPLM